MKQEKIKDYTRRITMANKTQMITILYEMILDYINDAEKELDNGKTMEYIENLSRAGNCVDELIHSLNLEYELGNNLLGLYLFEKRRMISAVAKLDKEKLVHVKQTFGNLHEAYLQLEKMDDEKAIMKNVPKVYVGLTYGRNSLRESVAEDVVGRGFRA